MDVSVKVGKDFLLDFNEEEGKAAIKALKKYGIDFGIIYSRKIEFELIYDDSKYYVKNNPGTLSFYKVDTRTPLVTYIENFGEIIFKYFPNNTIIAKIKIIEKI